MSIEFETIVCACVFVFSSLRMVSKDFTQTSCVVFYSEFDVSLLNTIADKHEYITQSLAKGSKHDHNTAKMTSATNR